MDPVVLTEEDAERLDSCESVLRYFDIRIKRGDHISSQDWLNAAARLNVLMRDEEVEWIRLEQEVAKEEEFYQTGAGGEMTVTAPAVIRHRSHYIHTPPNNVKEKHQARC